MKKILLLVLLLMTACTNLNKKTNTGFDENKKNDLYGYFIDWKGTPYKLGGSSKSGIDCSGFVKEAFSEVYKVDLPRTTRTQINTGKEIDYFERTTGDLVFFKTGIDTYHVGIYYQNDNFFHASTSKGVMMSNLNENYWINNFIEIRRILK